MRIFPSSSQRKRNKQNAQQSVGSSQNEYDDRELDEVQRRLRDMKRVLTQLPNTDDELGVEEAVRVAEQIRQLADSLTGIVPSRASVGDASHSGESNNSQPRQFIHEPTYQQQNNDDAHYTDQNRLQHRQKERRSSRNRDFTPLKNDVAAPSRHPMHLVLADLKQHKEVYPSEKSISEDANKPSSSEFTPKGEVAKRIQLMEAKLQENARSGTPNPLTSDVFRSRRSPSPHMRKLGIDQVQSSNRIERQNTTGSNVSASDVFRSRRSPSPHMRKLGIDQVQSSNRIERQNTSGSNVSALAQRFSRRPTPVVPASPGTPWTSNGSRSVTPGRSWGRLSQGDNTQNATNSEGRTKDNDRVRNTTPDEIGRSPPNLIDDPDLTQSQSHLVEIVSDSSGSENERGIRRSDTRRSRSNSKSSDRNRGRRRSLSVHKRLTNLLGDSARGIVSQSIGHRQSPVRTATDRHYAASDTSNSRQGSQIVENSRSRSKSRDSRRKRDDTQRSKSVQKSNGKLSDIQTLEESEQKKDKNLPREISKDEQYAAGAKSGRSTSSSHLNRGREHENDGHSTSSRSTLRTGKNSNNRSTKSKRSRSLSVNRAFSGGPILISTSGHERSNSEAKRRDSKITETPISRGSRSQSRVRERANSAAAPISEIVAVNKTKFHEPSSYNPQAEYDYRNPHYAFDYQPGSPLLNHNSIMSPDSTVSSLSTRSLRAARIRKKIWKMICGKLNDQPKSLLPSNETNNTSIANTTYSDAYNENSMDEPNTNDTHHYKHTYHQNEHNDREDGYLQFHPDSPFVHPSETYTPSAIRNGQNKNNVSFYDASPNPREGKKYHDKYHAQELRMTHTYDDSKRRRDRSPSKRNDDQWLHPGRSESPSRKHTPSNQSKSILSPSKSFGVVSEAHYDQVPAVEETTAIHPTSTTSGANDETKSHASMSNLSGSTGAFSMAELVKYMSYKDNLERGFEILLSDSEDFRRQFFPQQVTDSPEKKNTDQRDEQHRPQEQPYVNESRDRPLSAGRSSSNHLQSPTSAHSGTSKERTRSLLANLETPRDGRIRHFEQQSRLKEKPRPTLEQIPSKSFYDKSYQYSNKSSNGLKAPYDDIVGSGSSSSYQNSRSRELVRD